MRIIDSHFHWRPRSVLERICKRTDFPIAQPNSKGGYLYRRKEGGRPISNAGREWFDLDALFAHLDSLGHDFDVVCSIGPFSVAFSDFEAEEGRDIAMMWNEEMAAMQRKHRDRFYGTGALPLVDTRVAIEVMEHAVGELNLCGMNLPGSIGADPRIDAERLEPFYDRAEELGVTLFLHPTDGTYEEIMDGYGGALYLSLGRIVDVSVAAYRLVLSGIMERHPKLKIFVSHTGGALPYQSGRMDKNAKAAALPRDPSSYLKRMFTDTVSPHTAGMRFAIEYFGIDNIMYGTDYPCWDPGICLNLFNEVGLSTSDQKKIFFNNARRILGLKDREPAKADPVVPETIPA